MVRPLTRRGVVPQSQITNTGLMFPTFLHPADPSVKLDAALPFQAAPCLVNHALAVIGHLHLNLVGAGEK